MNIIYPKINMNGDTKEKLRRQFEDNVFQIVDTIEVLSKNMPNGRNYSKEEYKEARQQYQKHLDNLIDAHKYMMEIIEKIDEQ